VAGGRRGERDVQAEQGGHPVEQLGELASVPTGGAERLVPLAVHADLECRLAASHAGRRRRGGPGALAGVAAVAVLAARFQGVVVAAHVERGGRTALGAGRRSLDDAPPVRRGLAQGLLAFLLGLAGLLGHAERPGAHAAHQSHPGQRRGQRRGPGGESLSRAARP